MDGKAERHFEQILTRARQSFKDVQVKEYDISANRSVLYMTAKHDDKQKLELTDEQTFEDFVKMVLEFKA